MKKLLAIVLAVTLLAMGLGAGIVSAADPANQGEATLAGADPPMPLDGTWVILDEVMTAPAFFTGPWTWTSAFPVKFTITDLYVVSDQFEVYDNAVLQVTTPAMADWDTCVPAPDPLDPYTSPPWTGDPDVALADGRFSSAVIWFAPGSHSITIKDIHIPPVSMGGPPFPDGTVAFKAELSSEVDIDIKPWSDPNSVNRNKKGVIPVAILGSADFDPTALNPGDLSFVFCGATETAHDINDPIVFADHIVEPWVYDDPDGIPDTGDEVYYTANEDDIPDLVVHFYVSDMDCDEFKNAERGDYVEVYLYGEEDGFLFGGSDDIRIVK